MKSDSRFEKLTQWCGKISSVSAGIVAFLALLLWSLGKWRLGTTGPEYVPMAPSTALMMLLLSGALFARCRWPAGAVSNRFCHAIIAVVVLFSLLVWAQFLFGIELPLERWLTHTTTRIDGIPVGYMSPLTAALFLMAALALWFDMAPFSRRKFYRRVAPGLSLAVVAVGLVVLLGYAAGVPPLYGRGVIPMALLTSVAFILLGVGLTALTTAPRFTNWFLRVPAGGSLPGSQSPLNKFDKRLLLLLLALLAIIGTTGFFYLKIQLAASKRVAEDEVAAIADLKVRQILNWRNFLLEDANFFFKPAFISKRVQQFLADAPAKGARPEIMGWLAMMQQSNHYERVLLLDAHLNVRLSYPSSTSDIDAQAGRTAEEALRLKEVVFSDLHRSREGDNAHLEVVIPLLARNLPDMTNPYFNTPPVPAAPPVGLIIFHVDAQEFLYPLIKSWPTPSQTAETLLIRRDGDSVLYLNELRHRKGTALRLRLPINTGGLPAAMGARGNEGIVAGVDYRGIPVLAAVRAVPSTSWFLVAKVDQQEIYAPLRERIWVVGIIVGGFAIMAFLGVILLSWRRSVHFLHQELLAERARNEAEEALRQWERRVQDIVNTVDGIVWEGDAQTFQFTFVSEQGERILGYPLEQWLTEPTFWRNHLHPQDRDATIAHCLDATRKRQPHQLEYRMVAADGREVWFKDFVIVVMENGHPAKLRGIMVDITERKRAEQARLESEARFRRLAENAQDIIYSIRLVPELRYEYVSPAVTAITGYTPEEHYANPGLSLKIVHPEDRALFEKYFHSEGIFREPATLRWIHKDGSFLWTEQRIAPVFDNDGNLIAIEGIVRDITERRKLEDQLRQAQKMEAIGQLAGGIAHDFNNTLTTITGFGHLTLMKTSKDDPRRPDIEHILEAANKAAALTKNLLTFSRRQMINRKLVDLNVVVKRVETFLLRIIGEDIDLTTSLLDQPIPVLADSNHLEQVLMNLATNARDAMPNGGAFSLTTEQVTLDEEFVTAHGFGQPGRFALLKVSDTGVGMDEKTRLRIFEPFFTTKEVGKGTGLGLSIIYGIVKQHNGHITVYSEPGKGTTFRIYLPLETSEVKGDEKIPEMESSTGGTETILLAEDDESVRALTKSILEDFGYTVIVAQDGKDAVKKFMENRDTIQLLVSDLVMPKMAGREVYEAISKIKPNIPVLFVSGYSFDIVQQKVSLGSRKAESVLPKPFLPKDLLNKVRALLDNSKV